MHARIAALLTCYNRKATTLASLDRLFGQKLAPGLTVFLVDDNSPDGTAAAVHARFPQVRVLQGNGNLFWCGGMRLAFDAALKDDFAFYLWLNDDTFLEHDAIERLLKAYQSIAAGGQEAAIVVGSTRDPQTGAPTYGGIVRSSRIHPTKYRLLEPGDKPIQCDTMNGNCVLIPRAVVALTHNLSAEFQHALGDFDYGLRARKAGCTVWVAPGFMGTCAWNDITGGFLDTRSPFRNRWQHMMSNKGLPPGEYMTYVRRHGGPLWPLFWASPYVRVVLGSLKRNREISTA
jgi:GT2 family glycosyltransferase